MKHWLVATPAALRAACCIVLAPAALRAACCIVGVVACRGAFAQDGPRGEVRIGDAAGDESVVQLAGAGAPALKRGQVLDVYDESRVYFLPLTHGEVPVVRLQQVVASVVVIDATGPSILARVFTPPGKKVAELKNRLAVPNAARPYEDQPPVFVRHTLEPAGGAAWRRPVTIRLEVANEPGQRVVYLWSSPSGGALASERTTVPVNRWLPPARAGKYVVTVEARDTAGKTSKHQVEIESKGLAGPGGRQGTTFAIKRTFGAQPRFESVRDVTFDRDGRVFVLERASGFASSESRLVVLGYDGDELSRFVVSEVDVIAMAASDDALYVLDGKSRTVKRFLRSGADVAVDKPERQIGEPGGGSGPGQLSSSSIDLAVSPDGAFVYVLDAGQKIVHVFSSQGRPMHSLGAPAKDEVREPSQLENPTAIAVGEDGVLHVLDSGKQRRRVVMFKDGIPLRDVDVGEATTEDLRGLAVDPFTGEFYVLDGKNGVVKRFSRTGQLIAKSKAAEGSVEHVDKAQRMRMDGTRIVWLIDREGVALVRFDEEFTFRGRSGGLKLGTELRLAASAEGEVVVLDQDARLLTRFDRRGHAIARFGGEQLPKPIGVAVDAAGEVFVLDAEGAAVHKYTRLGGYLSKSEGGGGGAMDLTEVRDIQSSSERNVLMIAQNRAFRTLNLMDPSKLLSTHSWPPKPMDFENVRSAALLGRPDDKGGSSSFWVIDKKGERLLRTFPGEGQPREVDKLDRAREVTASVSGTVFVCDQGAKVVKVYDAQGASLATIRDEEKCAKPIDVAVDDYGRVYVYDAKTEKIVEFFDQ